MERFRDVFINEAKDLKKVLKKYLGKETNRFKSINMHHGDSGNNGEIEFVFTEKGLADLYKENNINPGDGYDFLVKYGNDVLSKAVDKSGEMQVEQEADVSGKGSDKVRKISLKGMY